MEDGTDDNLQVCSFVSVQYIICECGEVFGSEQLIKDHLERDHFGETKKIRNPVWPIQQGSESTNLNLVTLPIDLKNIKTEEKHVDLEQDTKPADIKQEVFEEVTIQSPKTTEIKKPVLKLAWKSLKKCDLKILPDSAYGKGKIIFENVDDEPLPEEVKINLTQLNDSAYGKGNIIFENVDDETFPEEVKLNLTQLNNQEVFKIEAPEDTTEEIVIVSQVDSEVQEWCVDEFSEDNSQEYIQDEEYTIINEEHEEELCEEKVFGSTLFQVIDEDHIVQLDPSEVAKAQRFKLAYQCSVCPDSFKDSRSVRLHETNAHKLKRHTNPSKHRSDDQMKMICDQCGKCFKSRAALSYHNRIHTGEKPFTCDYCGKKFTMLLLLQVHARIHTGERPYQCRQCPKAFGNKAAINRHMRVHTGVKPYACPECGKCFTQSNSMKLHVRCVHRKLPAPYKRQPRDKARKIMKLKGKIETEESINTTEIALTPFGWKKVAEVSEV